MKRKTLILIIVIALVVIAACIPLSWYLITHSKLDLPVVSQTTQAAEAEDSGETAAVLDYESMTLNGQTYQYRDNLRNYLFLGIDQRELEETQTGHANAGQCDAIFLISWDPSSGEVTMVSIPRDTITEITVYTYDGATHYRQDDHISLSYAYGDGKSMSCSLASRAVSNLLQDIPITGYMALDLDSLSVIMDTVGSFKVTIPNDSLVSEYPSLTEGTEMTLDSSNVELFVRSRDCDVEGSPLLRMERQQVFLEALLSKMTSNYKKNLNTIAKLYMNLGDYMVTNIAETSLNDLMGDLAEHGVTDQWNIPGTSVTTDYDEYHPDADALAEEIAKTFYKAQ